MYPLAIIGGGLSGLALAIRAAQQGIQSIVFEKKQYPFHRVCGEYIAMESWDFLERLGIPLSSMDLPRLTQLRVSAPNGKSFAQSLSPGGFGISRYTLDALLAEQARALGVEILENCTVQAVDFQEERFILQHSRGSSEARCVAGAFGKRSNIDIQLKRAFVQPQAPAQNYIGVKYHIDIEDFDARYIELHNFEEGYCGISQIEEGRYCLCYLTTAKNLRRHDNELKVMEEQVLMQNPFLKRYFTEAKILYDKAQTISNISFAPKSPHEDHILMLGDAAGMITPLCGNGMSIALRTAAILADMLPAFFEGKISREALEQQYAQAWRQAFALRIGTGRQLQKLFGKPQLTNWAISGLKPFPAFRKRLVRLTHGKVY